MLRVVECVVQQHDPILVALSGCICLLGCFSTVVLMTQAAQAEDSGSSQWLSAAAVVFGSSVWSLHFVAMLAFRHGGEVAYAVFPTAISIAVAICGTLAALTIWRRALHSPSHRVAAGLVLAGAIAGMHYLGVSAMQASGLLSFDASYVWASLIVCPVLTVLALARTDDLSSLPRRLEVTGWLTLAICGLHFTGMSAVVVSPLASNEGDASVLHSIHLGLVVALVSLVVLVTGLLALLMQRQLMRQRLNELGRMRRFSDLTHEALLIHRGGRLLEINEAGARLFETSAAAVVGTSILALFADDDAPPPVRGSLRHAKAIDPRDLDFQDLAPQELDIHTAAGSSVPVELSCRTIEYLGRPAVLVALRDLSQRKRDEARIRHLALHDALTDLPNRHLLEERLGQALEAAAQNATNVALIYLDLDRFKPVNDVLGHAAGDALLVQAAKRMLAELRPTDTLARVGGDEFVVVLTGTRSPAQIADVAARLVAGLGRAFHLEDHCIEIGASAGIALYPNDGGTAESLLRAADTALYRVKDEGRGALRFFEPAMDIQLQARRQLEHELRGAIERGELRLFYQPIVNGRTGEIETFEALIRWQHPDKGWVSPAQFIPLAEQINQIARIGEWVIDTACAKAATWPHPWRVSVNVSPLQFRQSDLPTIVAAALARHGVSPERLVLEITEGVFIQNAALAVEVLTNLRSLGIRLALDDFGTGYSSLSYLQSFKFDKIKVDQSFVRRLGQHADSLTIVRAIVHLAHNLGLHVTAEGVETVEQLVFLRALGCEQIQGYLIAKPGPSTAPTELDLARVRSLFADPQTRACA